MKIAGAILHQNYHILFWIFFLLAKNTEVEVSGETLSGSTSGHHKYK